MGPRLKYSRRQLADEQQFSVYNFEMADVAALWQEVRPARRRRLSGCCNCSSQSGEQTRRFPVLRAYEQVLKCSHLFNMLDARGAISVTERVGIIGRVRKVAVGAAQAWMEQNFPVGKGGGEDGRLSSRNRLRGNPRLDD